MVTLDEIEKLERKQKKDILTLKRTAIRELLEMCTKEQRCFFVRLYGSIDEVPENRLNTAIHQIKNTIRDNKKHRKYRL